MATTRQQYTLLEKKVFHENKHIEVDYYIDRKKLEKKIIMAKHESSEHQLADLTKPLGKTRVDFICDKLCMYDIYAPV